MELVNRVKGKKRDLPFGMGEEKLVSLSTNTNKCGREVSLFYSPCDS